jgi:hypothetical protein
MASTPVLLRVIPPQIDLSENIQPKPLIAQSPQQVRCVHSLIMLVVLITSHVTVMQP